MRTVSLLVALGVACALASCVRTGDFAELECTAQPTGLVSDCVVLQTSDRAFGEQTLAEVTERGTRPSQVMPDGPNGDPHQVADAATNIHPGFDKPLPRRFRKTIRVTY